MEIGSNVIHDLSYYAVQSTGGKHKPTGADVQSSTPIDKKNSSVATDENKPSQKNQENKPAVNPEDRLTEVQIKEIQKLKQRDQEVRTHEAAHLAAAGQYAKGGPTYSYERGPDGRSYAVGGEVNIDTSKVPNDPEATLRKAQQIRAAASAPADPSSQDRQVAAAASHMATEARMEIQQQQMEKVTSETSEPAQQDKNTADESSDTHKASSAYEAIASFDPEKKISIFNFVV